MASSRWKRFAFFEKHTLNIPKDVWEDLVPTAATTAAAAPRSLSYEEGNGSSSHMVRMCVTTAGLPSSSSSSSSGSSSNNYKNSNNNNNTKSQTSTEEDAAWQAMWQSLTACHTVPVDKEGGEEMENTVTFPPPHLNTNDTATTTTTTTTTALDGLVLCFLASTQSSSSSSSTTTSLPLVHCVDVTIRCNPPLDTQERELEDLDGWRGYLAPLLSLPSPTTTATTTDTTSTTGNDVIIDMATCRCRIPPPAASSAAATVAKESSNYTSLLLACLTKNRLVVWQDPHLYLTCSLPLRTTATQSALESTQQGAKRWSTSFASSSSSDGVPRVVSMAAPGLVAVGTSTGAVLVWTLTAPTTHKSSTTTTTAAATTTSMGLHKYLRIPPPPTEGHQVVTVDLQCTTDKAYVFVTYNRSVATTTTSSNAASSTTGNNASNNNNANQMDDGDSGMATAGLCCYEFPLPSTSATANTTATLSAPSARHDLDGRHVPNANLVGVSSSFLTVGRHDGLYSYSPTERIAVAPIDGPKLALAVIPPPIPAVSVREQQNPHAPLGATAGYALVASTDEKSGRDAVDIYDATNKLVAFHFLLSPGHKALQTAGVTTVPSLASDGSWKGGRSSALVFTSGGSLVTLTEKLTTEKVDLLVQKNLYSAAVVVAYADPSYPATEITQLYRRYAEHLYRKGDFSGALDQYIYTIGSLESSHVIFRYLDAPKIPLLVKYLEKLRAKHLATPVHNDLLRTCYLKLNDTEAAEAIAATASSSRSLDKASLNTILANLSNNPKEALATICTLEAHQAAEVLVIHGVSLARALPRETAGVVISLCVGTYSARALAGLSTKEVTDLKKMVELSSASEHKACEPYPVELFASAFLEHPKLMRLILAHCNRNKCHLSPSLRRTLLELTLDEWNQAKRTGDTEAQKLRHKEAIAALTDSHCREIGDYDALVICQLAGFSEGELILYERLQMTPMLLERYARDGSEKSRRQMLALCQTDPEVLADVLGHFVDLASTKLSQKRAKNGSGNTAATNKTGSITGDNAGNGDDDDDDDDDDEVEEILEDIQEGLALAKRQAVLPPVRIARILAGEGTGQFSDSIGDGSNGKTSDSSIPLSVALDFVGNILEESRQEISRLKSEVEDYNELCNSMEIEIDSLLRSSHSLPPLPDGEENDIMASRLNIDEVYLKILKSEDGDNFGGPGDRPLEAFWRDLTKSEDTFDTIARYFAKGVIQ